MYSCYSRLDLERGLILNRVGGYAEAEVSLTSGKCMQQPFLRNDAEMEAGKQIVDHMSRLDISNAEKMKLLQKVNADLEKDLLQKRKAADFTKSKLDALNDFEKWVYQPFVIEKNDCSRLHKLRQASVDGLLLLADRDHLDISDRVNSTDLLTYSMQSFVVLHDWAGAIGELEGSEINLPYERCAFEFRFNGKTVIALTIGNGKGIIIFTECGCFWACCGSYININDEKNHLMKTCMQQIKSICVALDADVATHHVERAPSALNKKRQERGKVLLNDYHVVNLAKHHRIANPSKGEGEHGKVRLHFRRGHWRHYETTKTWIKWCLVGNPDLGFINKHYSL